MAKTKKIVNPTAVFYLPVFCGKPTGYQAIKVQMVANNMEPAERLSIVEELHALTNRTHYVTMVKYLADSVSVPIERFEGSENVLS